MMNVSVCIRTVFTHSLVLYRCAHSFDFRYVNNSCVNTVRQHFSTQP